ncbi:unnamed protein product [Spirodela intermedia]|uniref:Uncharacterized protein n=1 Tax=Spirodela intermedia TaxID=51605 RepID=A0A7I8J3Z0_SPIIN|nr:unnamed protein product [Spirodela intermedia]CAA6664781.1 unnamed protein product [Spirodela intermedia]
MEDVLRAYSEVEGPNLVTWNAVLGGYVRRSLWHEAWEVFQTMENAGVRPNHSTLASALRACGGLRSVHRGNQVHAKLITHGFSDDIFLCNCLIDMHASCGNTWGCLKAFDLMPERDQVSWNTIISGFSHLGHPEESFLQFHRMQESSFKADRLTLASLLRACACLADASYAGQLHGTCALVDLYAKIGCMEEAYAVFGRLEERNEVPWNALISGYVQEGGTDRALEVFHRMRTESCSPDQFTYSSLLVLASELGDAELGKQIHSQVIRTVSEPSLILETELVHMHSKCGKLAKALKIFSRMPQRNAYSWNSLIEGFAKNGQPHEAFKLFHQMQLAGMEPDSFPFVACFWPV